MITSLLAAGAVAASGTPAIAQSLNHNLQQNYVINDGGIDWSKFNVKSATLSITKDTIKNSGVVYAAIDDYLEILLTNQLKSILGRAYSMVTWRVTTNGFNAYDYKIQKDEISAMPLTDLFVKDPSPKISIKYLGIEVFWLDQAQWGSDDEFHPIFTLKKDF